MNAHILCLLGSNFMMRMGEVARPDRQWAGKLHTLAVLQRTLKGDLLLACPHERLCMLGVHEASTLCCLLVYVLSTVPVVAEMLDASLYKLS